MVFDSSQMDLFFHMRSHYSRLKNVHSVVDCCAPKSLKRSTNLPSPKYVPIMAQVRPKNRSSKNPKDALTNFRSNNRANNRQTHPRAKSVPNRPTTRRHPEDTPHKIVVDVTPKKKHQNVNETHQKTLISNNPTSNKNEAKNITVSNKENVSSSMPDSGIKRSKNSHPTDAKNDWSNMMLLSGKPNDEKENLKYNTPISTPVNTEKETGPQEHEYLQFLLRITEDIIKNDLYSNEEIRKVLMSHINANKERLNLERMLVQIRELMHELNIPLKGDELIKSQSWSELEKAMMELIDYENTTKTKKKVVKSTKNKDDKYRTSPKGERCICFDARILEKEAISASKMAEKEIENVDYEKETAYCAKFNCSLDRVTERTEPASSRVTCKTSSTFNASCSTFGAVDVLPGFECLERCRTSSACVLKEVCKLYTPLKTDRKTMCGSSCVRKKTIPIKRRAKRKYTKVRRTKKRFYRTRHARCFDNVAQTSKEALLNLETSLVDSTPQKTTPQKNTQPVLITLNDDNVKKDISSQVVDSQNDYVFLKGPIYLLRTFMNENPDILMMVDKPSKLCHKSTIDERHQRTVDENRQNAKCNVCVQIDLSEDDVRRKGRGVEHAQKEPVGICKLICPNRNTCDRFNDVREEENKMAKLLTNDYDLTPQRDESKADKLIGEEYVVPVLLDEFLITKEVQTDDLSDDLTEPDVAVEPDTRVEADTQVEPDTQLKPDALEEPAASFTELESLAGSESWAEPSIEIETLTVPQKSEIVDPDMESFIAELLNEQVNRLKISTSGSNEQSSEYKVSLEKQAKSTTVLIDEIIDEAGDELLQTAEPRTVDFSSVKETIPVPDGTNEEVSGQEPDSSYDESEGRQADNHHVIGHKGSVITNEDTIATIEVTNHLLSGGGSSKASAMRLHVRNLLPNYDLTNEDNPRISILKNPLVPSASVVASNEEDVDKKEGSIIKMAMMDQQRVSPSKDKMTAIMLRDGTSTIVRGSRMEKVSLSSLPGASAGKGPGATSSLVEVSDDDNNPNNILDADRKTPQESYDDLRMRLGSLESEIDLKVEEKEESLATVSAPKFDAEGSDLHPGMSESQMRNISLVAAKLEQFRQTGNNEEDSEISKTLDKLVDTMKEQEMEKEENDVKNEPSKEPSNTSLPKKSFTCCGLRKKKKMIFNKEHRGSPIMSKRADYSEQEYRNKSQAFEAALSGFDEKSRESLIKEQAAVSVELYSSKSEENPRNSSSTFNPPIKNSGNRLSLVRIADEKEKMSEMDIQAEFDKISIYSAKKKQ